MKRTRQIQQLVGVMAITAAAWCSDPASAADVIRLSSGEVLTVTILETTDETIRIQHPVLGDLTLPRGSVEVLPEGTAGQPDAYRYDPERGEWVRVPSAPQAETPPESSSEPPAEGAKPQAAAAPAAEAEAKPDPPPKEWKFKFTLAGGAATGNTENANLVTKFDAVRETERRKLTFDAAFFYAESDSVTTETRATTGVRHDWLNPNSKWFFFADARYDFDDYQSWDHRVSSHVGIGYKLIEPPKWRVNLLAGIGAIKEWGSNNDDIRPEALFGVEGEWQIAEKHTLKFGSTIYPDLKDLGEFRLVDTLEWTLLLDNSMNMSLTAGLAHEYQSTVDVGRKNHDLRVYAGVSMEF